MHNDETQAFLDHLPELKAGETFQFACHPGVPCFNACCSDLTLMLTPYDVLRLRRGLGMTSREFIVPFCDVAAQGGAGFPAVRLRMLDNEHRGCPFVREAGCSIYEHRPSACRTYPLGRATRLDDDGRKIEQFFIVKEGHCRGFEQDSAWTSATWLADQGLEDYNRQNDRLMELVARVRRAGRTLDQKQVNMAFLALYQPDDFRRFVQDTGMLARVDLDPARAEAIFRDEEAMLEFSMDWLELALTGQCADLARKG